MLTKPERKVMEILYLECKENNSTIISPADIARRTGESDFTVSEVEKIAGDLNMDGYFDLVYSDRRGETVYCITLTEKGKGYVRSLRVSRRNLIFRIGLSFALAVFSFLVGLVLKAIF